MRIVTFPLLRSCLWMAALALAMAGMPSRAEETPKGALDDARKATIELTTQTGGELVKALEASGPLRAVVVCKYTVPAIASAVLRKYGARITRVSLTPRDPSLGWGDAWEQGLLMDFDARVAKGENPQGMEFHAVVKEPAGKFLRYMRVLPMAPVCTHCHGVADQISESIRSQLAHDHPHDKATGLTVGKVRGAVTYKKPL